MCNVIKTVKSCYLKGSQKFGAFVHAPSKAQGQVMLFLLGVALLSAGLASGVSAQGLTTNYNDTRISNSVNALLTYLEGTFGALVMVCSGIGAILSSAFGQYKAALGCLVVCIGAFILRSFLATFFNTQGVQA